MEATATMDARTGTRDFAWPMRMAAVLGFAALLFGAQLGQRALWSEEVRWLQIPREMRSSGDWLWPTINGHTYYDKPLGSYWLVLLAAVATGSLDEQSARLPSAATGLISVFLLMLIARRLFSESAAIWAGLILASSFSFVFFARHASSDAETVAGLLAALWLFLKHEDHPSGRWIIALWITMALTSLTKGLLGFALPILVITACSLASAWSAAPPRWAAIIAGNRWMLNRASLIAIPLAAAIYLTPFLASLATHGSGEGLAMVYRENVRRFFDPVNHRGPIYLYSYMFFMLMAPWSLLVPAALVHAHVGADKSSRGRLLALTYFWAVFMFFTLSASRRSYYLLPILPAGALLIAQLLTERAAMRPAAIWLLRIGLAFLTAALVLGGAVLLPIRAWLPAPFDQLPDLPCPAGFIAAWLLALAGAASAWLRPQPARIGAAFAIAAGLFMLYLFLGALPGIEIYRTQKPFSDAVVSRIGPACAGLALFGTREIVGQLDPPTPIAEFHAPAELTAAIHSHRLRWLIIRRRDWEALACPGAIALAETLQPWDGAGSKLLLVQFAGQE